MRRGGVRRRARARVALALVLAVAARRASAEGFAAYLQPGYVNEHTESTDATSHTYSYDRQQLLQNYRLWLDKDLFRNLTLSLGGLFQDTTTWLDGQTGPGSPGSSRGDQIATDLNARLTLSTPILSGGAGYEKRQDRATGVPRLTDEVWSGYLTWRPLDLPTLDMRVSHDHTYDEYRRVEDLTVTSAFLQARYDLKRGDVRYILNWVDNDDAIVSTESRSLDQMVQGTYNDSFFDGRTTLYGTATGEVRTADTIASGPGGTVATQRFPIAGFSATEAPPATPEQETLAPNSLIVDGNPTSSANVNLGWSRSLDPTDDYPRAMGAQFADVVTTVNFAYLYLDRALTPEAVTDFQAVGRFRAFTSDNNAQWTEVVGVGAAVWKPFLNRLEIPIPQVSARYVKIVAAPLPSGPPFNTQSSLSDIFVTELAFYLVVPASEIPRRQTSASASANLSTRTAILRGEPRLDWDFNGYVNRITSPSLTTYTVLNGLTWSQKLSRPLLFSARVARQDQDAGRGHEVLWQWSASLTATPVRTFLGALSYSGQYDQTRDLANNSATLFARAELYQGVSAQGNAGVTLADQPGGLRSRTATTSANVTVQPNQYATLTVSWLYNAQVTTGGKDGIIRAYYERVGARATLNPFPAFSLSGSVDRIFLAVRPTTIASAAVSYAPLRGDLQLGFTFFNTVDTAADTSTRSLGPTLRWNLRRGVFLDAAYSLLDTRTPTLSTRSRVFTTTLTIAL